MELVLAVDLDSGDVRGVEPAGALKVLLVYEDPAACNRSILELHTVARAIQGPARLLCALWSFKLLAEPALMKMAVREAAAADIIIVELRDRAELPATLERWIGLWPSASNGQARALVVLADGGAAGDRGAPAALTRFQEAARARNVHFFAIGGGRLAGTTLKTALIRALSLQGLEPLSVTAAPDAPLAQQLKAA